jgi:hypothetical protein
MEGEKFILYSNRKTNVHVFKYINPEGEEFPLDSRKLSETWGHRLSGHHALVRAAHDVAVGSDEWEEMLRIPWMKANEEAWGDKSDT